MATPSDQSKINKLKAAQLQLEAGIKAIQDQQVELQKKDKS